MRDLHKAISRFVSRKCAIGDSKMIHLKWRDKNKGTIFKQNVCSAKLSFQQKGEIKILPVTQKPRTALRKPAQ